MILAEITCLNCPCDTCHDMLDYLLLNVFADFLGTDEEPLQSSVSPMKNGEKNKIHNTVTVYARAEKVFIPVVYGERF